MLKGRKVILREKRIEDAADDYAWRTDPELVRLDAASPLTASFQRFAIAYTEELRYPSSLRLRFAIDSLDGKHIGNCIYHNIDEKRGEAELGIMIGDHEYWDKGYGTDAITTFLNYIFEATSLVRIYLYTLDWNIRAQKCFEKCGFVSCGGFTRDGKTFIKMETLRDCWQRRTPSSNSEG